MKAFDYTQHLMNGEKPVHFEFDLNVRIELMEMLRKADNYFCPLYLGYMDKGVNIFSVFSAESEIREYAEIESRITEMKRIRTCAEVNLHKENSKWFPNRERALGFKADIKALDVAVSNLIERKDYLSEYLQEVICEND